MKRHVWVALHGYYKELIGIGDSREAAKAICAASESRLMQHECRLTWDDDPWDEVQVRQGKESTMSEAEEGYTVQRREVQTLLDEDSSAHAKNTGHTVTINVTSRAWRCLSCGANG